MLRYVGGVAGGAALYLQGINDLLLAGDRLYSASRVSNGGITAFGVDDAGALNALGSIALSGASVGMVPVGLARVDGWGSNGLLLAAGLQRPAPSGVTILSSGAPNKQYSVLSGDLAGDLVAVGALRIDGVQMVFGLDAAGVGPRAWTVGAGGSFAEVPVVQPAPSLPGPPADLIAVADIGGQAVMLVAARGGAHLASHVLRPDLGLVPVQVIGAGNGLGLALPSALGILRLDQAAWAVVAGAGSSSLTVLRLEADGRMTAVFHGIDTLHSRFETVSAIATASVEGRGYVVAGGGDGGLSLLLLLPDGRLVHLQALAFGAGDIAPGAVSALAMRAMAEAGGTSRLDIFAAGHTPGIGRFAVDLGVLAPVQQAGAAATGLVGGSGNDLLIGGSGAVTLSGGGGDDVLVGGTGAAVMTGGAGRDLFVMAANGTTNRITDFNPAEDRIDLSAFPMLRDFSRIGLVQTAQGARLIWQETVIEVISSRNQPLRLADFGPDPLGGLAALQVPGRVPGRDMAGTLLPDMLLGDDGNDTLRGMEGDDLLIGGNGADLLAGGNGADTLDGGAGNDTLLGGAGDDLLRSDGGNNRMRAGSGSDTLIAGSGHDTLSGGDGDDLIDLRAGGSNRARGDADADTLQGGSGNDTLQGGAGNDAILAGGGHNRMQGGSGADTLTAGSGNDTLQGGGGNDLLEAGAGGNNRMRGDAGHDTLSAGAGADTVHGGGGHDRLVLKGGNDLAWGGDGNDTLVAGAGDDRLWGGAGADRFDFARAHGWNRIEDFSLAEGDRLGLSQGLWQDSHGTLSAGQVVSGFASLRASGHVVLDFGPAGTSVLLAGLGTLDGLADSLILL